MNESNSSSCVIDVKKLEASYGKGRECTQALKGICFQVHRGECVGFIGANGAGKSTTLKILMGFRFPDKGEVQVFGRSVGNPESRERIGYLPEVALYYPFMKARELLSLYGGLGGLSRSELQERIPLVLARVGLGGKENDLLKSFSKGMQQRLGIAQSLITEPELLIYDELSSGLDPLGRFELRELLKDLKQQGRTIFFSSHELGEVESLCDRVIMIHQGEILRDAPLSTLLEECGDRSLEAFYIQTLQQQHKGA
ncbi:ABC transporter ATP-binding protein [Kiritimatiellaeota bacterium B1221]|nr:ABC transporter ATP-binding protein [Kiritimatiellaeota bacterium B1221]